MTWRDIVSTSWFDDDRAKPDTSTHQRYTSIGDRLAPYPWTRRDLDPCLVDERYLRSVKETAETVKARDDETNWRDPPRRQL